MAQDQSMSDSFSGGCRASGCPFRHPLNPQSLIYLRSLSAPRLVCSASGSTSDVFLPEPSLLLIITIIMKRNGCIFFQGEALQRSEEETYEVGPGDYLLFTTLSVGHHLRNPFAEDLVYLMGGESRDVKVGEFPRLNKRAVFEKGTEAYIIDLDVTRPFVSESSR